MLPLRNSKLKPNLWHENLLVLRNISIYKKLGLSKWHQTKRYRDDILLNRFCRINNELLISKISNLDKIIPNLKSARPANGAFKVLFMCVLTYMQ